MLRAYPYATAVHIRARAPRALRAGHNYLVILSSAQEWSICAWDSPLRTRAWHVDSALGNLGVGCAISRSAWSTHERFVASGMIE